MDEAIQGTTSLTCSFEDSNNSTYYLSAECNDHDGETSSITSAVSKDLYVHEMHTDAATKEISSRRGVKRKRSSSKKMFNEKMKTLRKLLPDSGKVDQVSILDNTIEYVRYLQLQVQIMSLATSILTRPLMPSTGIQLHWAPTFPQMRSRIHICTSCNATVANSALAAITIPSETQMIPILPRTARVPIILPLAGSGLFTRTSPLPP